MPILRKQAGIAGEPSDGMPSWVFVLLLAAAGIGTGLVLVLIAHLVRATARWPLASASLRRRSRCADRGLWSGLSQYLGLAPRSLPGAAVSCSQPG